MQKAAVSIFQQNQKKYTYFGIFSNEKSEDSRFLCMYDGEEYGVLIKLMRKMNQPVLYGYACDLFAFNLRR